MPLLVFEVGGAVADGGLLAKILVVEVLRIDANAFDVLVAVAAAEPVAVAGGIVKGNGEGVTANGAICGPLSEP